MKKRNFESLEEWFIIEEINEGKLQAKMLQLEEKKENMKYAIAQTSGKQFWLKPGQWYDVDLIKNVNLGDFVSLNKVLFFRKNFTKQHFFIKIKKIYIQTGHVF